MSRKLTSPSIPGFAAAACTNLWFGRMCDLAGRVAIVPRTKNGDMVVVPLNADAMRALAIFRSRGDGTGRVVRNAVGEPIHTNGHWFRPAVR